MIRNVAVNVFMQRRVWGRGLASFAHVLLFSGFVVLSIGTTLIAIEHVLAGLLGRPAHTPVFHFGVYYAIFEFTMDTFGIAFLIGIGYFAHRRRNLPTSVSHDKLDWVVLASLFAIGVSGYVVEGLRIVHESPHMPAVSPIGWGFAKAVEACGLDIESASSLHFLLWWIHALLALGIIASKA